MSAARQDAGMSIAVEWPSSLTCCRLDAEEGQAGSDPSVCGPLMRLPMGHTVVPLQWPSL